MAKTKPFEPMRSGLESVMKQVEELVEKWIPRLGLETWRYTVVYKPHPLDGDDSSTGAMVSPSWEYKRFTIRFYLSTLKDVYTEPDALEKVVLHELSHVLVSGMSKPNGTREEDRMEERTVVELTDVLFNLSRHNPSTRKRKQK